MHRLSALITTAVFLLGCDLSPGTSQPGALRVHGVPGQGILVLDGTSRGPIAEDQTFDGLRAGTHVLELYPPHEQGGTAPLARVPAEVRSGQILAVRIEASAPAPAPATAPATEPAPASADNRNPVHAAISAPNVGVSVRGRVQLPDSITPTDSRGFASRVVLRMLQTRQAALLACYERELGTVPTLAGTLRVELTLEPGGATADVRVQENTIRNPAIAECVIGIIQRFRFAPGPGASTTFSFPLTFAPLAAAR